MRLLSSLQTPKRPNNRSVPLERVAGIEPATQPWEGRVLPLNHTRKNRLGVYLLGVLLASLSFTAKITQATETLAFDFTDAYVQWGKTFDAGDAKAGIFPNGLVAPAQVTWTVHEGSVPTLPPNRAILGNVYRLSIDGNTSINPANPRPIAVALPFGNSYWIRQVWVYDLDAKIWNPLPTKLNTSLNLGQAPSGIQRGLYAILEDRNQQEGIASWYCKNFCSSRYPTLHGTSNDYPIGSYVRVRSLETGRTVEVKIISTWGQPEGRIIDLSWAAYEKLGASNAGLTRVNVSPVSAQVLGAATASFSLGKIESLPNVHLVGNNGIPFPTIRPRPFAVYDQTTNRLLAWYRKDDVVPIASITKLMTAAVFLDTHPNLDTIVTYTQDDVTPYAYLTVQPGDTLRLRDLFYAMLVASANNAAPALARSTGMTQEQFVAKMNEKAQAWGLGRTHFVDVHGLSSGNVSTAEEVARMAAQIFHEYEPVRYVTVRRDYAFRTINTDVYHSLKTTDALLGAGRVSDSLIFTGGKTGYLDEAKYTFVTRAASKSMGAQVVTAIMQSASSSERFSDAAAVTNWAFANHNWAP